MSTKITHLILLLFLILFLPSESINAQYISGQVLSAKNQLPIPFVTISFNEKTNVGTISNIDGYFEIPLSGLSGDNVNFSCLSYQDTLIQLSDLQTNANVYLRKEVFEIAEVNIIPEDNPAFPILRNVHENRRLNNPENLSRFECQEYSQTTLKYNLTKVKKNSPKSLETLTKEFKDKDAFFLETIFRRSYDKSKSHSFEVVATRFPGADETSLFFPTDMVQPFHFYDDYVLLGDKKYLNPIGDRNFSRYYFYLKDSLIMKGIKTYVIDYRPKSALNYQGLEGTLMISSDHWAIKSVTALPFRNDNITVSILQNYTQINGQWFPLELNYEMSFKSIADMPPFSYIGQSYFTEVVIGNDMSPSKTSHNYIELADGSANRDSSYWNENRPVALDRRQLNTYEYLDTLVDLDTYTFFGEKLTEFKVPISVIDVDLEKLYSFNDFEGNRIGVGVNTNERLSKRVSLGGFLLYGTKDEAFKYGANLEVNIARKTNFKTYLSYNHSYIKEIYFDYDLNSSNNISFPNSIYNQDFLTEYRFGFMNTLRRVNLNYYAAAQSFLTYSESPSMNGLIEDMLTTGIYLDFDFYRKNMSSWISPYKSINATSVTENRYVPTLQLLFEKGFVFEMYNYSYDKLQLEFNSSFNITKLGRVHYSLQSGKIWGDLPYSKLFRGGKMYAKNATLLFDDAFQTVAQNEFSNSEYLYLFLNYKFGAINFKSRNFLPQVVLYQNLGIGRDNDSFVFQNTQPMDKLLVESGLGIENLFRVSLFNVMYLGGGAAVFCRLGEQAMPGGIIDNLTYRAILTLAF